MFRNLWNNLSKSQRVGLLVVGQMLVIIILALTVQSFTREKTHVEIENSPGYSDEIPSNAEEFISDNIWQIIKSKVADADRNDVEVTIREGTLDVVENDDGSVSANFIVDIDSLKQTFTVSTGWTKNGDTVFETIVDCPPISEMKYPETVCYGAYYNTYSLDLYLPYIVYPEGAVEDDDSMTAPNYMISGDEETKTLDVMVSACDVEGFKKAAWDYLNGLPIDFTNYTVNYEINDINVEC